MKRRDNIFYGILFGLLMLFLFSFMVQEHLKPFKAKPLTGNLMKIDKPQFSWEWYKNGDYQKKLENYVSNKFGFREFIIRMYHQYGWDFYGKVFVSYIYKGKENWLFYDYLVHDQYGLEMFKWFPDAEAATKHYEQEVRLLNKVKGVLDEYGITLMTFITPSKNVIYPEYLPTPKYNTTSVDANPREYFSKRFQETGLPCFEMNEYFKLMKDTCSFYLFPPTSHHWNFSCVYATDSLMRFMEQLRDIQMPRIQYGNVYKAECRIGEDKNHDMEAELNLLRPIKYDPKFAYKELDYQIVTDSATTKPSALFIGNSFLLLRTIAYIPPEEVFSDFQLWYYNKVAYQGLNPQIDSVSHLNRLDYLVDADYIVFSSSASQLYRATEGFAEDAILQLCIGEERFRERKEQLIDSLFHNQNIHDQIACGYPDSLYLIKLADYTDNLLRKNPEAYFPEIAGEGIPSVRNPLLLTDEFWRKSDIRKKIKRDPQWMLDISNQMVIEGLSWQQSIDLETERVIQWLPLSRGKYIDANEYREILIKKMEQRIKENKQWLEMIEKQAAERGISLEENIYQNAVYMVDQKSEK
jgi:hypothetical protein